VDPSAIPLWQGALLAAWFFIGVAVVITLLRQVTCGGGLVSAAEFGPPEFALCSGLLVWFAMAISSGFDAPQKDLKPADLLRGGALLLAIMLVVCGFLYLRNISPVRQFGLRRRNAGLSLLTGAGILLAAYPLLLGVEFINGTILNGRGHAQDIIQFFRQATAGSRNEEIALAMFLGVIVAPIAEETIFRGFIYGVLKRYLGAASAALISAAFFTGMHCNSTTILPLFALALCLTLAYEATGCLLVNIAMHALFNLTTFLVLLYSLHS
jgi:membrane protease YdiL (CAAX protease family)